MTDKVSLTQDQLLWVIQSIESCIKQEPNYELKTMIVVNFLKDKLEYEYD